MKQFFTFGLIIAAALSCKHVNVDKEIASIDSLINELKSIEITMEEINLGEMKTLKEQIDNQITLVKSIYGDSIEWENAKTLSQYYRASKSMSKYLDKRSYISEEISYSYQQLRDLSSDLKNNILPSDSFHVYFDKECKAAKSMTEMIEEELRKAKTALELHKNLSPQIEEILKEQKPDEAV